MDILFRFIYIFILFIKSLRVTITHPFAVLEFHNLYIIGNGQKHVILIYTERQKKLITLIQGDAH